MMLKCVVVLMFLAILTLTALLVVSLVRGVSEMGADVHKEDDVGKDDVGKDGGRSFDGGVSSSLAPPLAPHERVTSMALSGDHIVLLVEGEKGERSLILIELDTLSFVKRLTLSVGAFSMEGR